MSVGDSRCLMVWQMNTRAISSGRDVDAIKTQAQADEFVRNYGVAIVGTAEFGGAISVMTNSSMNKKATATDMQVTLTAEIETSKLDGKGSVKLGTTTSTEDKNFSYKMNAYGGNLSVLFDEDQGNKLMRWADTLDPEDTRKPISIVNLTFLPISVLAGWKSNTRRILEETCAKEIARMEAPLRDMFVERPPKQSVRESILFHNRNRTQWLIEQRNRIKGKGDRWWIIGPEKKEYDNGVAACDRNLNFLRDFDRQVNRPDQSGESLKKWAEDKLLYSIKTAYPRTWGFPSGNDSIFHNWIFERCDVH